MSGDVDLKGKVAVVTGSSRGLGKRVALRLARHGAAVALVARSADALEQTADEIRAAGGMAVPIPENLFDLSAAERVKAAVEASLGKPSILVNSAGIFGPIELIKDVDAQQWLETMTINMLVPVLLARAFVNGMIEQGWGRIVNFTSAASLHNPSGLNSAYATSKVALNQFTRHLAAELEGTGVTANVLHPGDVKTEMWEYIRNTAAASDAPGAEAYRQWVSWVEQTGGDDPEKAADLVLNLMSEAAASVSGQFLWIEDPLQAPIPSWGEPTSTQPWRK